MPEKDEDRSWVAGAGHPSKALPPAAKLEERLCVSRQPAEWPPPPTLETPIPEAPQRWGNPFHFVFTHRVQFGFVMGTLLGAIYFFIGGALCGAILGLIYGLVDGLFLAGLTWIVLRFSHEDYRLCAAFLRWFGPVATLTFMALFREILAYGITGTYPVTGLDSGEIVAFTLAAFGSWISGCLISAKLECNFW